MDVLIPGKHLAYHLASGNHSATLVIIIPPFMFEETQTYKGYGP